MVLWLTPFAGNKVHKVQIRIMRFIDLVQRLIGLNNKFQLGIERASVRTPHTMNMKVIATKGNSRVASSRTLSSICPPDVLWAICTLDIDFEIFKVKNIMAHGK